MEPQRVADRIAHFRIVQKLGQGGMGVVYKAVDERLGRPVALKLLPPAFTGDAERRARFVREARAAAAVVHPNIAVIYEIGDEDGTVYIAMEWIDGRTLRDEFRRDPVPPAQVLRIGLEIVRGVACAHERRIVHRDLKPDNVMVSASGSVKILDFGLAKLLSPPAPPPSGDGAEGAPVSDVADTISDEAYQATEQQTITATGAAPQGTPAYMSPEHARGLPVDQRSDIFSIGAMLYEMLAGITPFKGQTTVDVLVAVISLHPPPIPGAPAGLMQVIDHCLEKDPARRYQSCAELVADLEELQRGGNKLTTGRVSAAAVVTARLAAAAPGRRLWALMGLAAVVVGLVTADVVRRAGSGDRRGSEATGEGAGGEGAGRKPPRLPPAGPARVERLTTNSPENNIYTGSMSPDGRYLAYATDDNESGLLTVATGAKAPLSLPRANILDVSWTRDSRRVLTTIDLPDGTSAIWAVPIDDHDGKRRVKIAEPGHAPAASPDGKTFAYVGPGGLWVAGLDGSAGRVLASTRGGVRVGAHAWSPHGKRIVFSLRLADRSYALATVALDGPKAGVRQAVPEAKHVANNRGGVAWLADGRVAYVSDGPGVGALSMIPIDEDTGAARGPVRQIVSDEFLAQELSATGDGRRLAYKRVDKQTDVYVAALTGGGGGGGGVQARRLTLDEAEDVPLLWSDDGREVLFTSRSQRHTNLYRQRLDAREPTRIRAVEDLEGLRPSPDGKALLGWRKTGARSWELRAVPRGPSGGEALVTRLDSETEPTVRCARAPATLCLVGAHRREDGMLVVRTLSRTAGGPAPETKLGTTVLEVPADEDPEAWDLSPRGDRVAVIGPDERIRVMSIGYAGKATGDGDSKGGGLAIPYSPRAVAWNADGASLLLTCSTNKLRNMLVRLDLDGRLTTLWTTKPSTLRRPSASPDGKSVMFSVLTFDPDFWLVTDF